MNVVAHNISSMFTDRQLGITTNNKAKSAEKLSSGYKINRAADDAAGLSISEKMRRQIRGLNQGSNNIQDGISLCKVTDGAIEEITDCLQRMHELSIKAYNGTNSEADRNDIQSEIGELRNEIQRIADSTKFNEIYVLKGDPAHYVELEGVKQISHMEDVKREISTPSWLAVDDKVSLHNISGDESVSPIPVGATQYTGGYMLQDANLDPVYYGPSASDYVKINQELESTDGYRYVGGWTESLDNNRYASIDFSGLSAASSTGGGTVSKPR